MGQQSITSEIIVFALSGIEDDETLCPLLVHDPVSAFPAPDGVTLPDFVLRVALAADVDHRLTESRRGIG